MHPVKSNSADMNVKLFFSILLNLLLSSTHYVVLYDSYNYTRKCFGQNKIKQQLEVKLLIDNLISRSTKKSMCNYSDIQLIIKVIC